MHQQNGKYSIVRSNKGGGTRELYLSPSDTKTDILELAKTKFFPQGRSCHGSTYSMEFDLVDSQGLSVTPLVDSNGNECEFSVKNYTEITSISRLRLYLASRLFDLDDQADDDVLSPANSVKQVKPQHVTIDGDSDDDDDFNSSVFLPKPSRSQKKLDVKDKGKLWRQNLLKQTTSPLMGSSEERLQLKLQQDKEYEESALKDKLKDVFKDKEKEEKERLEDLRKLRASRVPPEPVSAADRVRVVVHHPTQGRLQRYFQRKDQLIAVYDWVGSISSDPENFTLPLF